MGNQERVLYQNRVIEHSLGWVMGKPVHNETDNECVRDFSCCHPDLFTEDENVRIKKHKDLCFRLRGNDGLI